MAPPNSESMVVAVSLQKSNILEEASRPNKRLKETNTIVSNASLRATSPLSAPCNNDLINCLKLLFMELPDSLSAQGDELSSFRELWSAHGFRTSVVTSPHQAVSIYLDSCRQCDNEDNEGKTYLLSCIGMHPCQIILERVYATIKSAYCLHLFLRRIRTVREQDVEDESIRDILTPWETEFKNLLNKMKDEVTGLSIEMLQNLSTVSSEIISKLVSKLTDVDHSIRSDQLLREYNRITYENCTLTNACLQRFLYRSVRPRFNIDQVHFQFSPLGCHMPSRERITIRIKEKNDCDKNDKLIFLPSLLHILNRENTDCHPFDRVVEDMIDSTWTYLLRNGYCVDQNRKDQLSEPLKKFYLSGLLGGRESNMPVLLNTHFMPTYPLSLYIWGEAGAGKSSFVRNLLPALNSAIALHSDPELMVRFVKQNLNKPFNTLELELELRPNNNDYSVMSIIQGRRMTLAQNKPGLVLVALEEMPSNTKGSDPNQFEVSKLISMRFSGRNGQFSGSAAPRNSSRGINGDATIINVFTSNYNLEQPCLDALRRLEMFQNLHAVQMTSVSGQDREAFARSYLIQRIKESLAHEKRKVNVNLQVPLGDGDTRQLVRYLRLLSFYIHALVLRSNPNGFVGKLNVSVSFDAATKVTTVATSERDMMQLSNGISGNIYAVTPIVLDVRSAEVAEKLQKLHPDLKSSSELCQILDFYFANTLAPAVVTSENEQLIKNLITLLSQCKGVHAIENIDPSNYKIMKSLYDSSDTPNLRDDILNIANGSSEALIAIQLNCKTSDAQMQIREIIEDTPSMTAFSTERSALHKGGLFFGVFVDGVITPEIKSRTSLII